MAVTPRSSDRVVPVDSGGHLHLEIDLIDEKTGDRYGVIEFNGDIITYVVTPGGHKGAYRAGQPIAVSHPLKEAIEADMAKQDAKG